MVCRRQGDRRAEICCVNDFPTSAGLPIKCFHQFHLISWGSVGAVTGQGIGKPSAPRGEAAEMLRGKEPLRPNLVAPAARRLGVITGLGITHHHTVRGVSSPFANSADAYVVDHEIRLPIEGVTPTAAAGITHVPNFASAVADIFCLR